MKIVIFGLSISSSWGNGHATLWRGLCRELDLQGHHVVFFERDVEYYRKHRDYYAIPGGKLILYQSWSAVSRDGAKELADADVGIITSYCPDGIAATDLLLTSHCRLHVFYDLDTPVTLARLCAGEEVSYLGPAGMSGFDLVLSYTGGRVLDEVREVLGAREVAPLYGSVDPDVHHRVDPVDEFRADLSYLGTYSADRQRGVEELLLKPAAALPDKRFLIGGSLYPRDFPWRENVYYREHTTPKEHPAFYCSTPLTLNVTRKPMAESGWCPSGRLFEAAACGTAVVSDRWEGLDHFYEPGVEIFVCSSADEVIEVMKLPASEHMRVAEAARRRTLAEHTSQRRAAELIELLETGLHKKHAPARPVAEPEATICGA